MANTDRMNRRILNPVRAKELYDQGLSDREIADECAVGYSTVGSWRVRNGLKANPPKKMQSGTKRCDSCLYWRSLSSGNECYCACHHLLDTGKRRVEEDGVCKSYIQRDEDACKKSNRIPVISTDQDGNEVWYPSVSHAAKALDLWNYSIARAIESGRPCQGKRWRKAKPDERPQEV